VFGYNGDVSNQIKERLNVPADKWDY